MEYLVTIPSMHAIAQPMPGSHWKGRMRDGQDVGFVFGGLFDPTTLKIRSVYDEPITWTMVHTWAQSKRVRIAGIMKVVAKDTIGTAHLS
jgi:hypothetical protein